MVTIRPICNLNFKYTCVLIRFICKSIFGSNSYSLFGKVLKSIPWRFSKQEKVAGFELATFCLAAPSLAPAYPIPSDWPCCMALAANGSDLSALAAHNYLMGRASLLRYPRFAEVLTMTRFKMFNTEISELFELPSRIQLQPT